MVSSTWLTSTLFLQLTCLVHISGAIVTRDHETAVFSASWPGSVRQARKLVEKLSLDEMNELLYTYTSSKTSCTLSHGVDRLGFPGYCLNDGPAGPRAVELVNAYPAGLSVAAAWNKELAYDRGLYMGKEFKAKGTQVAFAPVVGPLGRIATGGRNWEGFGADPYLQGKLGAATIEGLQKSIIATIKHFVGNEQETRRNPLGVPLSYSSNIDDQTMHELYMWPFQDAVRAGVGSAMCSYNRLNSTYACENEYVMNKLLKEELAFPGFIISDDFAQHAFLKSANAGLDMSLGSSQFRDGALAKAVRKGNFSKSRLEDMATRVLASWIQVLHGPNNGSFPEPGSGYPANLLRPHHSVDGRTPASKPTILKSAIEGHVLVKNMNDALPLGTPLILSLYGYDATLAKINYPSSSGDGKWTFGIQPFGVTAQEYNVIIAIGTEKPLPQSATFGTALTGGGSGSGTPSFVSDPYSAILQQAEEDNTALFWDFHSLNPAVNPSSDACLVFLNNFAVEGADRNGLTDSNSDKLVKNVAAKCKNTVVVIHNQGIRVVDAWILNPNVTAVLLAHTPGQVSGKALVNILYGKVSPSGRLPYTIPKLESDFGHLLNPCETAQCNFTEREQIDYRRFLAHDITPRFPFGFGLTYSKFKYSDIAASFTEAHAPVYPPNPDHVAPGGVTSLFDVVAQVTATLQNVGKASAAEVAQLYVQFPGEKGMRQLRGFSKEYLEPGQSAQVKFSLTRRDLSRWDVVSQKWKLQFGQYTFYVGPNVQDIALKQTLSRGGSS